MKKIYQQVLDFPGQINDRVLGAKIGGMVDGFDSNNGIRCYFKCIYQLLAFVVLLSMLWATATAAASFLGGDGDMLSKAGSVLTAVICLYAAFPLTQIIRSRGDSLGTGDSGVIRFLLHDFMKTNIRLVGEVTAVTALVSAVVVTVGTLLNGAGLFSEASGALSAVNTFIAPTYSWAVTAMNGVLDHAFTCLKLDVSLDLNSYTSVAARTAGGWNAAGLETLVRSYVDVIQVAAAFYVILGIYGFLYSLGATLLKWISNPSLPFKTK
ncbi:MAG: hypothetical protein EPO57_07805 [Chitinophagaceae bacterium]|nr:MAG: hypothetical protein EPO57_07805 [Chitinophagaceae bacterium]